MLIKFSDLKKGGGGGESCCNHLAKSTNAPPFPSPASPHIQDIDSHLTRLWLLTLHNSREPEHLLARDPLTRCLHGAMTRETTGAEGLAAFDSERGETNRAEGLTAFDSASNRWVCDLKHVNRVADRSLHFIPLGTPYTEQQTAKRLELTPPPPFFSPLKNIYNCSWQFTS